MSLKQALRALLLALALTGGGVARAAEVSAEAKSQFTISDFSAPIQFSYGDWKDNIQVADKRVVLKSVGSQGGAGVKVQLNLDAYGNLSPVLRIKTNADNAAKMIQLQLTDASGFYGSWQFDLPDSSVGFVNVAPKDAAALEKPNLLRRDNQIVEGKLDLSHIVQYQLKGDWQKNTLDVEVESIVLVTPDAGMLAQRQVAQKADQSASDARAKALADETQRLAREREQKIKAYSRRSDRSPQVTHVSLVAPDLLAITIEAQRTILPVMTKYEPQAGDEKREQKWKDGVVRQAYLYRNGKRVGRLQGSNLDWFFTSERMDGDPLLEFMADDVAIYTVKSGDDPAFSAGIKPASVSRKSVPQDVVLPGGMHPTRHNVYLKLPSRIMDGKNYSIKIDKLNVKNGDLNFKADLKSVRTEAVHVNQIGYRPDDPVKRAFLSIWTGTGGPYTYSSDLTFSLLDDATGQSVMSGKVERILDVDGKEELWTKPPKNYAGTAVYRMDFSSFSKAGTYRVYVDGIGCSYPFEIGKSTWEKAFLIQMKGLYNQRSGVELGPPYTEFKKPRDFHPDDGTVVTRSTYDVMTKGFNAYADIAKLNTGEAVKNAWGGYHDAGDWNPRRVTHMYTTLAQLELCDLYPSYFNSLKLNIPPMDGVPDMITEALFEIDCFRRLQLPDGAMPYGIETDGDPLAGEVSWLSTMHCYVLAPNLRDSWLYAAVAGRAAKVLKPFKPELAKVYEESAARAFKWAEAEMARKIAAGDKLDKKTYWDAFDARVLSSLVLYDITDDQSYHDIFKQQTCLKTPGSEAAAWGVAIQCDPIFLYARMDASRTDPKLRETARSTVIALAERSLKYASGNAFNITQRERGRPMFAGFFSTSGGTELVRAHYLTGNSRYLAGAVQSCQFQSGCNPNNIVYTTGVGANPVKVPLELDARSTGQPVPVGLTVFGNSDYFNWPNSFWDGNLKMVNKPEFIWPEAHQWPPSEAYFDVWILVSANEYVIDTWAPNVLVWGYLSARQ